MAKEQDKYITADVLREIVREEAARAGGVRAWCKLNGIGNRFVYEVLQGIRQPSAMLANRVGYRRVIRFEPFE